MRIGICDDSSEDLGFTRQVCEETFAQLNMEYEIITFSEAKDILEYPDDIRLLILDIEMPVLNGIDLKRLLQERSQDTIIIFVTNHDEMVLSAFGMNVFGFVIKKNIALHLPKLIKDFVAITMPYFMIDSEIDSRDVKYIKAARVYTELFLKNGEVKLTRRSIREYEQMLLACDFCRIHKSYLLNLNYADKVINDKICVGNEEIPIATRNKKEVIEQYRNFCRKKARYS